MAPLPLPLTPHTYRCLGLQFGTDTLQGPGRASMRLRGGLATTGDVICHCPALLMGGDAARELLLRGRGDYDQCFVYRGNGRLWGKNVTDLLASDRVVVPWSAVTGPMPIAEESFICVSAPFVAPAVPFSDSNTRLVCLDEGTSFAVDTIFNQNAVLEEYVVDLSVYAGGGPLHAKAFTLHTIKAKPVVIALVAHKDIDDGDVIWAYWGKMDCLLKAYKDCKPEQYETDSGLPFDGPRVLNVDTGRFKMMRANPKMREYYHRDRSYQILWNDSCDSLWVTAATVFTGTLVAQTYMDYPLLDESIMSAADLHRICIFQGDPTPYRPLLWYMDRDIRASVMISIGKAAVYTASTLFTNKKVVDVLQNACSVICTDPRCGTIMNMVGYHRQAYDLCYDCKCRGMDQYWHFLAEQCIKPHMCSVFDDESSDDDVIEVQMDIEEEPVRDELEEAMVELEAVDIEEVPAAVSKMVEGIMCNVVSRAAELVITAEGVKCISAYFANIKQKVVERGIPLTDPEQLPTAHVPATSRAPTRKKRNVKQTVSRRSKRHKPARMSA